MTIAVCHVAGEGIVLGADSLRSRVHVTAEGAIARAEGFEHQQKVFALGESLGVVCWGMSEFEDTSHRVIAARVADDLRARPATSVVEVTQRHLAAMWPSYRNTVDQLRIPDKRL